MLKITVFLLILSFANYEILFAQTHEEAGKQITMLNGTVILEVNKTAGLVQCIVLQFSDKNINMGWGTYFEVRKRGDFFVIDNKRYVNMDDGIVDYMKRKFEHAFSLWYRTDRKKLLYKDIYWPAFVDEGCLKIFMDLMHDFIDDEFLNAPFNHTDG